MSFKFLLLINIILMIFVSADEVTTENSTLQNSSLSLIRLILSFMALALLVGLSQAGGIGGGPILSPVMMFLLGLDGRKAVWNTYVMMFGGSIGNYIKLSGERVQQSGSPLINYRLVVITLPLLLAGAVFGVATGRAAPKLLIAFLLFLVLVQVFVRTYRSYRKQRVVEIERSKKVNQPRGSWIELIYLEDNSQAMTAYSFKQEAIKDPTQVDFKKEIRADQLQLTSLTTNLIYSNPELFEIYENEKVLYPRKYILHLVIQVLIIITITFMKGTNIVPSLLGIEYCSSNYHVLNICIFIVGLLSVYFYRNMMLRDELFKEKLGYDFDREAKISTQIDQTVRGSLLAGFLGGLVGLGGGTVLTPLWLEMGIPSQRAAASATFCVFFTSFISVFSILIVGGYQLQELILYGLVSSVGSYIISGYLKDLVIKFQRESIIVQVLLFVVLFALVILPLKSYQDIKLDINDALSFGRFC